MPDPGELLRQVIAFIGDQIGSSSLRLGPVPAITIFLVILVLLSLVARPSTGWATRDLGGLTRIGRAMAFAAESGTGTVFSLGTAGIARATSAVERLQTLAALPILGQVADAAARSGVSLRVTTNDPIAAQLAGIQVEEAHRRTATLERSLRSRVEYVGEGRATAAADSLSDAQQTSASFAMGGISEDALLLAMGAAVPAAWSAVGTAVATQASSMELTGNGALIGPELFQAPSDLRATGHERTGAQAANRLMIGAIAILVIGSLVAVIGGVDLTSTIAGH